MDPLSKTFTIIFLVATMLSIGLKVTATDLLASVRDRRRLALMLATNFVIIPAMGLLLTAIFPMGAAAKAGFLLLAVAPGGLNAIQFTSKTTGGLSFAATTLFILSFLSVLLSPLIALAVLPMHTSLSLPYGRIILVLLLLVIAPVAAGLLLQHKAAALAHRLAKPIATLGTLSFVVVVILLWGVRKQAKASLLATDLLAMLIFIVAAMLVGWFLGGPDKETRRVLATSSSMRNVALGLMIAASSFPGSHVDSAVIGFGAIMIPLNMLFTLYSVVKGRRDARRSIEAGESPRC